MSTWLRAEDCRLDEFRALVEQRAHPGDYPYAEGADQNVLVYDSERLRDTQDRMLVQAEFVRALLDGPGIIVLKRAFADLAVVDQATDAFNALIAEERAAGTVRGDHFAKPGANDRLWSALDKIAIRTPEVFAAYYANDMLALAAEAWLGPAYQVTSQVNLLTLQGAVAHCDMPVESGPTMYLPHSQKYEPGYLAWRLPEFIAYFDDHYVQLPLEKGDAVFFNPALFHAAGHNRSADIRRMANLLQVSSAFGRAMETVDREAMANALFPVLLRSKSEGATQEWLQRVVAACAEGYPFPTSLDLDPPVDGLAPRSQADIVWQAVSEGWSPEQLRQELRAGTKRRRN